MEKIIILAMFAQVTLSLVVMLIMGKRRFAAAKNKQLQLSDFKTMRLDNAGDTVRVADRNFTNQFEIPVLFTALACLFVISRIVHTVIHIGSNNVRLRFNVFLLGCASVFALWLAIVWRILAF